MDEQQTSEQPTGYMERTRQYYRALGYKSDYVWSTYDEVPFVRLGAPMSDVKLALLTTASPPGFTNRDAQGRKHVWVGSVTSPPETFGTEMAWDRDSTHTDDPETFLPLKAASALAKDGLFAGLTEHFIGVPTKYSQSQTITIDAPDILERLRADGAQAAVLAAL
ncbi:MAG: hypothetical protein JXQ99_08825 [Hyphomicrobiaceae bacterium]